MAKVIKKTLFHPKANEVLRKRFQNKIFKYVKTNKVIVYIDESGFSHDAPRTHGYSTKGTRCYGVKDWNTRGRLNAIGAIIDNRLVTVCLFDVNIDSDVFYAWLTKDLIPKLPNESVIVMDNASFHKRLDMSIAIHKKGHILEYLPPYSPGLNPIEHKWAEIKAIRRQRRCSAHEAFYYHQLQC